MVCEHLRSLENELASMGVKETFRGEAWSRNCREWVYYDCYLDLEALRERFSLDPCVLDHENLGTHDGRESGFVCEIHNDGIMGVHKTAVKGRQIIK